MKVCPLLGSQHSVFVNKYALFRALPQRLFLSRAGGRQQVLCSVPVAYSVRFLLRPRYLVQSTLAPVSFSIYCMAGVSCCFAVISHG